MRLPSIVLASLLAATPAVQAQQGVQLASGLTDFTTWNLAGTASAFNLTPGNGFTYSNLVLTQGLGDEAGSGFAPAALVMDFNQSFYFNFNFFIPVSADTRGDGLTFTLSTAPGLGGGGSGLGYEGMAPSSLALAIDTFHFDGDPISPSLQLLAGGSVTPLASVETGLGDSIRDPNSQWWGELAYTPSGLNDNAGDLKGSIHHTDLGSFEVQAAMDFAALGLAGNPVHYGFTAANGLATDAHWITSAVPVPEPQAWALMLCAILGLGAVARSRHRG